MKSITIFLIHFRYTFNAINDSNLTAMCMCDLAYPSESAFEFLKDILLLFQNKFSKDNIKAAYAYSLNKEFLPVLRSKMSYYNKNIDSKANATLNKLKETILETKTELMETTEKLQEREVQMKTLIRKAYTLKDDSTRYFLNARKMKESAKGCNFKKILKILLVISLCYLLTTILCGGATLPNCLVD